MVTVTLNGKNYHVPRRQTVPELDGSGPPIWRVWVRRTATPERDRRTNGVGNSVSNSANLLGRHRTAPTVINTVAGDNVINAAEVAAGQTISGAAWRMPKRATP